MQAFGLLVAFALAFLVFPDGCFTPPWTRGGFVFAAALMAAWLIFPDLPFNPTNGASFERTPLASTLFTGGLIAAGVTAQMQRYRRYATPLQRRQIMAGAFGFLMLFVAEVVRSLSYALTLPPQGPGDWTLFVNLARYPLFILLVLFLPVGFGVAILRYQLWNFDLILRRTALYSLLTAGGIGVYALIVILSSIFFERLGGVSGLWFVAASALSAALLFLPVYRFAQQRIDRLFNRRWIDFQAELARFTRSVRTKLTRAAIAEELIEWAAELMGCESIGLALGPGDSGFRLVACQGAPPETERPCELLAPFAPRLAQGATVALTGGGPLELLVPLRTQRLERAELVGVLLCGPRRTGQPYERADLALLAGMADQAASALLVAELVESERRLELHRSSPLGQAEALADSSQEGALLQAAVLTLFEAAMSDPLAAQQLAHLPAVLRSRDLSALGLLAEGCHLLIGGRDDPSALAIGLQRIDRYLAENGADDAETSGNRGVLAFCIAGLGATNVAQIVAILHSGAANAGAASRYFAETGAWISRLTPLGRALDRFGAAPSGDDRLHYLVDGLSLCNTFHAQALGSDTPTTLVIAPLLARWNQLLVDALAVERARILITLQAVTQRVLAGRPTELVVEARNEGRRAAQEVCVAVEANGFLAGAPPAVVVGPLPPGGAARLHFPATVTASGPFSVSFRLAVADGNAQPVRYSVALSFEALGGGRAFRPIPNPYVTGAPLRADSPLFVGRADDLAFLSGALDKGPESPAVVLTGPKRMGKTSLLNRLAGRLGEAFVPAYVDGQGIGYTSGLGNLLWDVAAEIARPLAIPLPPADSLPPENPAFFTNSFLPQVREALGERRLVLLWDEYEELAQRVGSGVLGQEVYGYLRHLMQHQPQLGWVFAGTHGLADLPGAHWTALFSGAAHRRVGRLDGESVRRLATEPAQGYLDYDDLALERLMSLTGGHPYFLQVLCHGLVLAANRNRRVFVAAEDVEAVAPAALDMAEAHLLALWRELAPAEQGVAVAAARLIDRREPASAESIARLLPDEAAETLDAALASLVQREVLTDDRRWGGYRFVLDLQRRWMRKGIGE